jgi:GNAT superfamily N-acetyltransferase
MAEGVHFRNYQESDTEALSGLFIRAIQTVYPDLEDGPWISGLHDIERTYLDTGGVFRVGVEQGVDIAMGGIKRVSSQDGEIVRFAVEPAKHKKGIGQALLEDLESCAVQLGMVGLVLDTTAGQVDAIRLYERNGYNLVDRRMVNHPTGKIFDTLFYAKSLD